MRLGLGRRNVQRSSSNGDGRHDRDDRPERLRLSDTNSSDPASAAPPGTLGDDEEALTLMRRGDRLRQQTLPAHVVTFRPRSLLVFYFGSALVFVSLGASILASSAKVRRSPVVSYSDRPACDVGPNFTKSKLCTVSFTIERTIPGPSYLYYGITNFYQNVRKYASSRSDRQLRGMEPPSIDFVRVCKPILYKENTSKGKNGFNVSELIIPCGLTAFSQFNDTFTLCLDGKCANKVPLRKKGIAWDADRRKKFRRGPAPLYTDEINDRITDEDFMVWMRLSTFRNFDKLYRIIDGDLKPGTYHMRIRSSYPVSGFGGSKRFFISSMSWIGGKNNFLGVLFVVSGVLALLIAIGMLARDVIKPRPPVSQNPDLLLIALARLNCEFSENNSPRQGT